MNQDFDAYIHEESGASTRSDGYRWNTPLVWTVLLILGFLVYEITARPAYGITIVCVKFGWNYFRSAFWLLRTDPNRQRSWACFWLYLAAALTKIAVTASMILVGLGFLAVLQIGPNRKVPANANANVTEFFLAYATAIVAFALSGLVTMMALAQGARRRIKFWLDPGVERARKQKWWPPIQARTFGRNKIYWLLGTTFVFFFLPLYLVGLASFFAVVGQAGGLPPLAQLLFAFLVIAPVISLLALRDFINRRLVANAPWECWSAAD